MIIRSKIGIHINDSKRRLFLKKGIAVPGGHMHCLWIGPFFLFLIDCSRRFHLRKPLALDRW